MNDAFLAGLDGAPMAMTAGMQTRWRLVVFNLFIICWLSACTGQVYKAPVSDVAQPPGIKLREHIVAPGETLYSIAWRYNMDHRELARVNGIGSNYLIYPGQHLSLDVSHRRAPSSAPVSARKTTQMSAVPQTDRLENQTPLPNKKPAPVVRNSPSTWQWPVRGPVLEAFRANGGLNKGIDIGGKLGEPVLAAAAGDVVYSGSGLRGYGKLVIVKHSEKYLSAYAHNQKILVSEGEVVEAGQPIAKMGSSGTDRVKLHFEIRYSGKPVDPLEYLPAL